MRNALYMLCGALLLNVHVQAKELPPQGGQPQDFKLTQTRDIQLDNGLMVTFVQYGKTPKVTLRLITDTGNVDDQGKDAVSDISYQLLTEGTQTLNAKQIAEAAAEMGGQVNTSVATNASFLQMDVLSEFAPDAVRLLADLAIRPKFAEADLQRAVANFVRDLKVSKSQAQSQATEAFYRAVYGDHPYANVFADEAKVQALTLTDVQSFVSTNLVAKRSHLYVSGQFDEASTEQAVRQAFADMSGGQARTLTKPSHQAEAELVFIAREQAPQSTIRLGLPVVDPSHPDFVGLTTMNTLLGGAFSSRITSNIREDKGYTYSPNSSLATRVGAALWYEGADVTAESTGAAIAEIIKEIKRLQTEAPAKQELEGFKNYLSGIYVLQNSSRTAIINQLWNLKSHGLPLSHLQTYLQKVNALTPEQISALAAKYLPLDRMTLVVVGDPAVQQQLGQVAELKSVYGL